MHTLVRIAAALFVLVVSAPALAQSAAPKPRFLIDAIEVRGLRWASERVIVAETRLHPGREYTEAELHAGAGRVARLPFVVRVDLRLDKGESRGAYRLIIEVVEAKPVFFGGTLRTGGDEEDDKKLAGVGARLFLGRSGVVHGAATTGDEPGFDLGYTQYDIFGSGVFAAAVLEYRELTFNGRALPPPHLLEPPTTKQQLTTHLIAGIPLRGNHAVRANWTREPTVVRGVQMRGPIRPTPPRPFSVQYVTTTELAYIYDSTDDPLFPSRGASILGSVAIRRGPYVLLTPTGPELSYYERPSFTLTARKNWPLRPGQSLWTSGTLRHTEREAQTMRVVGQPRVESATSDDRNLEAGYAFTVWGDERPRRVGELRAELGVGYRARRTAAPGTVVVHPPGAPTVVRHHTSTDTPTAHVGLVFRNPWAVFQLRFEVGE